MSCALKISTACFGSPALAYPLASAFSTPGLSGNARAAAFRMASARLLLPAAAAALARLEAHSDHIVCTDLRCSSVKSCRPPRIIN